MLVGLCTRDRLIREAEPARLASWITMARQTRPSFLLWRPKHDALRMYYRQDPAGLG
jgi:hypothetical protein